MVLAARRLPRPRPLGVPQAAANAAAAAANYAASSAASSGGDDDDGGDSGDDDDDDDDDDDPNGPPKLVRRRARNRVSARKSRMRKKLCVAWRGVARACVRALLYCVVYSTA